MSAVLAGSPSECCTRTVHHTGKARGTTERIADLDVYVARPPQASDASKIILFFSDIFGPFYLNLQLLMDYFADQGFLVLGVDYLKGESWADKIGTEGPGFANVKTWIAPLEKQAAEITPPWCEAVRKQFGGPDIKFFCVGYCLGGPFVANLLATDWVTAGAFAHPSSVTEAHIQNIKKPLLLSCAEFDVMFPTKSRQRAEEILVENKVPYTIQVFGQVAHGFGIKGDPDVPAEKWAKEESARAVANWFLHHAA